jgi:serine/threonine protein phosphatase PrpC
VQFEFAKVSLIGHRSDNQDRVEIIAAESSVLMIVVDGMGGHAKGAMASEVTVACLARRFRAAGQPVLDPQGFLIAALAAAHEEVVALGAGIAVEHRPRATCAVCLVQDDNVYAAHVGDSRIYQLRGRTVLHRSRDHSHVQLLLHEGVIDESEVKDHPMRNFVECCLGGDEPLPDMSIDARRQLARGDVVLLCSDGLWTGLKDEALFALTSSETELEPTLLELANQAIEQSGPNSDNTTAAVLRLNGATT